MSLAWGVRPTKARLCDRPPQNRQVHCPFVKLTSLKQQRKPPHVWQRVASRETSWAGEREKKAAEWESQEECCAAFSRRLVGPVGFVVSTPAGGGPGARLRTGGAGETGSKGLKTAPRGMLHSSAKIFSLGNCADREGCAENVSKRRSFVLSESAK